MTRSGIAVGLVLALGLTACGGGGESSAEAPDGAEAAGAGGCEPVEQPEPRGEGREQAPRRPLDAGQTYDVTLETNCGSFTIRLDLEGAPRTAASFVQLTNAGFFDGTAFHRIVPGFVIQGGDPTGTGTGGPGYKTVDTPPRTARYTKGVVAMAKTAAEPPGTAGSQFFVVTADDARLPPDYAIVGEVSQGLEVVERIGRLGDPATERPTQPVVIRKATVSTG